MKQLSTFMVLLSIVMLTGCKSTQKSTEKETQTTMDNSKTSLDWSGYYVGTLPCADCPGIYTEIQLNIDETFILKEIYMDREVVPRVSKGTFSWNSKGNTITFNSNGHGNNSYLVGENALIQLDMNGNEITGDLAHRYKLEKKQLRITNTHWKLVELNGQKVDNSSVFVVFSTENYRVYGKSGCNNFTGIFDLKEGNQISLSQIASTRMACPDMDKEQSFLSVLGMTDNYSLSGVNLSLNKARMAPLARFEADYTAE